MRRIAHELRYRHSMRRARREYRNAVDRGGRQWTRDALYERLHTPPAPATISSVKAQVSDLAFVVLE